jgi:hypothetical protein
MNKFEQLIEYVINDEEQKARDLFHEIVVEKSRGIYEELMAEEVTEEVIDEESTHDEDEKAEKAGRKVTKDIEYDDKKDKMEEGIDEVQLGGDQADDLIDDIESEEQGLSMEAEGDNDEDHHDDVGGNEELEDRVVDLEDKLDELMAEFEAMMDGDQDGDEDMDMDMDVEVDDEAGDMGDADQIDMDTEFETEGMKMPMEEAINLKAAPAPVKSEEGNINKKSTVAANSGARGMDGKPVMSHGAEEKGRPAPTTKDIMSGEVQNAPAKSTVKQEPATKPHLAQASGVNTKSPY